MRAALAFAAFVAVSPAVSSAQPAITSPDDVIRTFRPAANGPSRGIRSVPVPAAASPEPSGPAHHDIRKASNALPAATRMRPAAAAAPAMTAAEPSRPGDLAALNMQVQFATGSDQLTPQAVRTLSILGKALSDQQLGGLNFRIEGHTDTVGGAATNEALSLRRANAVVDFITSHYSMDRARLTPVGLGESQPLVPTGDGVPEPRNRRVVVVSTAS